MPKRHKIILGALVTVVSLLVATWSYTAPPVRDKVLEIVAAKTGYPPEMLELDLDLEADLGIDTVKQAEVFAMVREAFGIPRQDDLKLSDYPTLGHVIGFVHDRAPALTATTPATPPPVPETTTPVAPVAVLTGDDRCFHAADASREVPHLLREAVVP